jgi:hypothetical protein
MVIFFSLTRTEAGLVLECTIFIWRNCCCSCDFIIWWPKFAFLTPNNCFGLCGLCALDYALGVNILIPVHIISAIKNAPLVHTCPQYYG